MIVKFDGREYGVILGDDGTMDTIVSIDGQEVRYDCEYASSFRRKDGSMTDKGLKELALEALDDGTIVLCPQCKGAHISLAKGSTLNKCLSCHTAFDSME